MPNPDGSIDTNAYDYYETSNGKTVQLGVVDGSALVSPIKITSHCTNFILKAEKLIGGRENCVDINNETEGVTVAAGEFAITGNYGLSAKTSRNTTFRGHLTGKPKQWHVNLGSWSDQSAQVQTGTRLELTADVYPILVWLGNADRPRLDDEAKYKVIGFGARGPIVRSLVMFFWGIAKKLHLA
jgi:hypothetical protein